MKAMSQFVVDLGQYCDLKNPTKPDDLQISFDLILCLISNFNEFLPDWGGSGQKKRKITQTV